MEIELICRIIDSEAKALGEKNVALLTEAQKAKLKVLEDAMKLAPTIVNAQRVKLLPVLILPGTALRLGDFSNLIPWAAPFITYNPNSCAAAPAR
ncbi:MAG: hypothetical protein HY820_20530 [Acidobacteria bacterium]|nr:hypothetical protein [Acidobacteriota bacterium]